MSEVRNSAGDHWRGSGGRRTEQRDCILNALEIEKKPTTAQELYLTLKTRGESVSASLATVYRTLSKLAEAGLVDCIRRDSGEVAYLLCRQGHHHHLTCRSCGRVEEVRNCELDGWAAAIALTYGFTAVEHSAELTGICASCGDR